MCVEVPLRSSRLGRGPMKDQGKGEWFWESGFNKHPIDDLEQIRDWNFRAVYGAFNAMKNRDGKDQHLNAKLDWIAYVGGTRESRRIVGDVMLTHEDIVTKREFPDGCVPSTWSIDLHFPKDEYAKKFPDNPFISYADHDRRVDRAYGYPIPYRCLYSVNVNNLFMAGRNISVTDHALGTVRVMKTIGMMGEVVGKAASIAVRRGCTPREVYTLYWQEMDQLLKLPGRARRLPDDTFDVSGPAPAPVDDSGGGRYKHMLAALGRTDDFRSDSRAPRHTLLRGAHRAQPAAPCAHRGEGRYHAHSELPCRGSGTANGDDRGHGKNGF